MSDRPVEVAEWIALSMSKYWDFRPNVAIRVSESGVGFYVVDMGRGMRKGHFSWNDLENAKNDPIMPAIEAIFLEDPRLLEKLVFEKKERERYVKKGAYNARRKQKVLA